MIFLKQITMRDLGLEQIRTKKVKQKLNLNQRKIILPPELLIPTIPMIIVKV